MCLLHSIQSRVSTEGKIKSAAGSAPGAALADHEIVERIFGHLPPEIFVRAEGQIGVGDRLEPRILQAQLRVKIVGRLETDFEDFLREEAELRPSYDEPLQRPGVRGVILRPDAVVRECAAADAVLATATIAIVAKA